MIGPTATRPPQLQRPAVDGACHHRAAWTRCDFKATGVDGRRAGLPKTSDAGEIDPRAYGRPARGDHLRAAEPDCGPGRDAPAETSCSARVEARAGCHAAGEKFLQAPAVDRDRAGRAPEDDLVAATAHVAPTSLPPANTNSVANAQRGPAGDAAELDLLFAAAVGNVADGHAAGGDNLQAEGIGDRAARDTARGDDLFATAIERRAPAVPNNNCSPPSVLIGVAPLTVVPIAVPPDVTTSTP